jgi:hypothetical protein
MLILVTRFTSFKSFRAEEVALGKGFVTRQVGPRIPRPCFIVKYVAKIGLLNMRNNEEQLERNALNISFGRERLGRPLFLP